MRLRLIVATALAVPFLAACGGTSSTADPRGTTPSSVGSDAALPTSTSSAPAPATTAGPTGPVLDGQTFTMTLPAGGHVDKDHLVAWSHSWDMGDDWSLDGVVTEQSCGGSDCAEDTAATRAQEARFLLQDLRTEREKRLPDVTVGGITMVHTRGGTGKSANEEYGVQYQGRDYCFDFEINLGAAPRRHAEALIQQILATITFKG